MNNTNDAHMLPPTGVGVQFFFTKCTKNRFLMSLSIKTKKVLIVECLFCNFNLYSLRFNNFILYVLYIHTAQNIWRRGVVIQKNKQINRHNRGQNIYNFINMLCKHTSSSFFNSGKMHMHSFVLFLCYTSFYTLRVWYTLNRIEELHTVTFYSRYSL